MQDEIIIIYNSLIASGSISGLLFLFFRMLDSYQKSEDRIASGIWYKTIWKNIEETGIYDLPFSIIKFILAKKNKTIDWIFEKSEMLVAKLNSIKIGILIIVFFFICSTIFLFEENGSNLFFKIFLVFEIIVIIGFFINKYNFINNQYKNYISIRLFYSIIYLSIILIGIYHFLLVINSQLFVFAIVMLIILTLTVIILLFQVLDSFSLNYLASLKLKDYRKKIILVTITSFLSFNITMFILYIGNLTTPNIPLFQSLQLLISNAFFDGFTLITTFFLLKWAFIKRSITLLLFIIIIDIILSGIFGCAAIYIGLITTEFNISLASTVKILFAKSNDGLSLSFNSYFWVMHTTFIPTLVFLLTIGTSIIGKYFTVPIVKFLKGVSSAEKPHYASATTFGFIGALLIAIAELIKWLNA